MNEEFLSDHENKQDGTGEAGNINNGHVPETTPSESTSPVINPEPPRTLNGGETSPGFLELVYGILFEPGKTMKKVAERPPLGYAALVVAIISLLGAGMGLLTASRVLNQSLHAMALEQFLPGLRALAPMGVILGLLWGYVKWFVYSAVLHLASDLLGGRGGARGVFAAVGLAWLPSILMIPVQFFSIWFGTGNLAVTILVGLAGLAVGIWSIILMVIGLKEVHGLSTGRAVLAVFSPMLALIALAILMVITLVVFAASMPNKMHFPGYF